MPVRSVNGDMMKHDVSLASQHTHTNTHTIYTICVDTVYINIQVTRLTVYPNKRGTLLTLATFTNEAAVVALPILYKPGKLTNTIWLKT